MARFLVVADLDSIQDYVFGTTRLPTIRGASAVVEAFGEAVRRAAGKALPGCRCIRHQGGQAVLVYKGENPGAVEGWLQRKARQISAGALTATTGCSLYRSDDQFKAALSEAFAQVQGRKQANTRHGLTAASPLGGGYVRHCDLCRLFPATPGPNDQVVWQPGGDKTENRHLCAACWQRLERRRKGGLEGRIADQLVVLECLEADELVAFPDELMSLWPDNSEGRYLAMVAADGDGIGRLLADIPDATLYEQFSQRFSELVVKSIASAACAAKIFDERSLTKSGGIIPLMPIVAGGDDFSVLLRPKKALKFACELAAAFADLSEHDPVVQNVLAACLPGASRLTLSVGLVITKPHFPFSLMRRLAEQLRSNAKRGREPNGRGTIDFALISSAGADTLAELRRHYSGEHATQPYRLTQRPYSVDNLEHLLALKEKLTPVPRSQRKLLYTALWQGPGAAAAAYEQVFRRGDNSVKDILEEHFGVGTARKIPAPFAVIAGKWQTPLLDALELIDL